MKHIGPVLLVVAALAGCNSKQDNTNSQTTTAAPVAASDTAPAPQVSPTQTTTTAPPAPRHNYAINQDGTYGYEPGLSEDDIRAGKTAKPLVMMRYVGLRDGTYVLLLIDEDNPNFSTRVACQAPCEFAKSQTMAGDMVVKTETIRVAPGSLLNGMVEDAVAGQLIPFGQRAPSQTVSQAAVGAASSSQVPQPSTTTTPATDAQHDSANGPVQQTSFDCSKAKSIPEFLICHDPDLAAADRDLADTYRQAKEAAVDKTAFNNRTRRQWNFRERNCRDKDCLMSWYAYQKRVLSKIAQTGDAAVQDN
nr:hypothetical protein [Burkholderia vietnamiensis]